MITILKNNWSKLALLGVFLGALTLVTPIDAQAKQEPTLIGNFSAWSAYKFKENGAWVCYMVSQPQTDEGNYTSRGDIYSLITHRPSENTKHVFSYMAGYPYKKDSKVNVSIDGRDYLLFSHQETAWAPDSNTDYKLMRGVMGGSQMMVKGTSSRGTKTIDTFSLKGSSAAYKAISRACGV